jgi:hypothetical protein
MYAVKLLRRRNDRDEEYGRVILEGETVTFQGLSSIFESYLHRGIVGNEKRKFTPRDGLPFLQNLKYHRFDLCLRATDIEEISEP